MLRTLFVLTVAALLLPGCADDSSTNGSTEPLPGDSALASPGQPMTGSEQMSSQDGDGNASDADSGDETSAESGDSVALTPDNCRIAFVGTHTGDDPDPRNGHFPQFTGTATLADGGLTGIEVEIDTTSLATEIEKLTNHLKSADFFNVNEFPTATFRSTGIDASDDGNVTVTGDLTLLGNTKSISFPATVSTENGLSLTAEFTIDRTEFGMNFGTDRIEKGVAMTISVDTAG